MRGVLLAALVTALTGVQAQTPAVDTARLGPQVGQPVPPIAGVDQTGTPRTLSSIAGPKGAMLVFFRSADW